MSILHSTPSVVNPSTANPRDSWPVWTDRRWTLSPQPIKFGLADRLWFGETTALLLTATAFELIEEDDGEAVDDLWLDLEDESREEFRAFLRMLGSPATGWSTWLRLCSTGSPLPVSDRDEPRPTAFDGFIPTIADDLEAAELLNGSAGLLDADDDLAE
jgi:hypothetical protein